MPMSHYAACHTCKQVTDSALNTKDYVYEVAERWQETEHAGHDVQVLPDFLGFIDEYDELFDRAMKYERVPVGD